MSGIDLTGQHFGRLIALKLQGKTKQYDKLWLCLCECGSQCEVRSSKLRSRHTRSCGCLQKDTARASHLSHGRTGSKLYKVWAQMKRRCSNPRDTAYASYGGRGIHVCREWQRFEQFQIWAMIHGYREGLSIDRVNNDGGYEPDNCIWTTQAVQNRNTRSNITVAFNGQTIKLVDWADFLSISPSVFCNRLRRGWSAERVLTQPVRGY